MLDVVRSRDEIYIMLKTILVESFELSESDLSLEANFYEDLDIDSIDAVDLIVELKDVTGSTVDPASFKKVRTIQDLVQALYEVQENSSTE